ncbi:hypothetical protein SARC_07727 [Sphaeroforma arctica JP610]|uniref:Uncharacterized protein n=1 Tax=Sphaeroforma arctica JP610 TaxID=667725 RepID=A0A0L0FVB4_9EUKA|nr:hypothetical protein SARC_07727 [Sphaeroforma arctica JP610]KNC79888.1 hypothetical protein SARC_07727 [Sphaeroforma arctica JP610]|eukprot:XP_014153790.1 hypothetical protein SARC_07727 [Sphaeroforma arctica JP610]
MTHYGDGTEMVPLHFWEDKHVEVFEKFTYNKRPLGTFPGALRDIKEDTVCFKTIHFQYDDEMTARLRGHSNLQAKHESSMSQISDPLTADKHFVNTNYYKMLQLASGFQKKMHKSFKVDQIPMIPNRCLLITRREGRNGHDTFREIVNEAMGNRT